MRSSPCRARCATPREKAAGGCAPRSTPWPPRLDPATLTGGDLSATVVVAQLRSAVVDLYEIAGVDAEQAKAQLV